MFFKIFAKTIDETIKNDSDIGRHSLKIKLKRGLFSTDPSIYFLKMKENNFKIVGEN